MKKCKKCEELECLMKFKGVSKMDLANKTCVSEEIIELKFNGESEFTIHEAEEISKFLDLKYPTKYFFK